MEASIHSKLFAKDLLALLEEKSRQIIELYYWGNFTLKEIGTMFDLCESRVSQIITKALDKMRRIAEA